MDLAESLIRKNGYNGVSFRDLASGVGVKSSSVHYYFPTKEDLGAKVARRYTDRFLNALGDPEDGPAIASEIVKKLHGLFVSALGSDGQMCLCGILAAESAGLPESVVSEAKSFFDRVSEWMTVSLSRTEWAQNRSEEEIKAQALSALALLEGGMIIARVRNDPALLTTLRPQIAT
ncbi:TetR/AcrR family transcriptional regulator [Labrenzia sp. R4_2]|nr:TetR/AcrR family transcriptional regulator [Labrenzia sp. R4_2]